MTDKTINVLIVNYNTQKLTEACIKSINKHTPGVNIYMCLITVMKESL